MKWLICLLCVVVGGCSGSKESQSDKAKTLAYSVLHKQYPGASTYTGTQVRKFKGFASFYQVSGGFSQYGKSQTFSINIEVNDDGTGTVYVMTIDGETVFSRKDRSPRSAR